MCCVIEISVCVCVCALALNGSTVNGILKLASPDISVYNVLKFRATSKPPDMWSDM